MSKPSNNFSPPSKRRCLYEILEIPRNASPNDIKLAYKSQARIWHPDKNIDNAEEATLRFKEINEAFEILSDEHERAWYDAHRDAILRGFDKHDIHKMKQNDTYEDELNDIDLMPYFSTFAYNSFDKNDSESFYNVYNEAFRKICEVEQLSKTKTPLLGNSDSSYRKVNAFYEFWELFHSKRNFNWSMTYNLGDAPNRRIRRAMHKENKKSIDSKRRNWEQTVTKLVDFIKKRDPRLRAFEIELEKQRKIEEAEEREHQRLINKIMKEQLRKQRQMEQEQMAALLAEKQEQYPEIDNVEEIGEVFECVVCNKTFKSEKTFQSHEQSKKHLKALANLKIQMEMEQNLIFDGQLKDIAKDSKDSKAQIDANGNDNEMDCKQSDQNVVDAMIAKQIAHQQSVENDQETESEIEAIEAQKVMTDNDKIEVVGDKEKGPIDVDYLLALSMEQEEILDTQKLFEDSTEDSDDNNGNTKVLITDSEIVALLESGIEMEALLNTYPTLTKEYIIAIKNEKNLRTQHSDRKKKKRKKHKMDFDCETCGVSKEDNDGNIDEFMQQFKTSKGKKNNKSQIGNEGKFIEVTHKKRRRRRKDKELKQNVVPNQNGNQRQKNMNYAQGNNNVQASSSQCKACNAMFGSKTKLFAHLKQFPKHALKSQHQL